MQKSVIAIRMNAPLPLVAVAMFISYTNLHITGKAL